MSICSVNKGTISESEHKTLQCTVANCFTREMDPRVLRFVARRRWNMSLRYACVSGFFVVGLQFLKPQLLMQMTVDSLLFIII